MDCPKCSRKMDRIENEPDVNVVGGWECTTCDEFVPEFDVDMDDL